MQDERRLQTWGPADANSSLFAARLLRFSIARAVVFAAVGGLILTIFYQNRQTYGFSYYFLVSIMGLAMISSAVQAWAAIRRFHLVAMGLGLLIVDQALFSALAYLTGGVASAATSLLGVSCLVGGLLLGAQGAGVAAFAGGVFFSLIFLVVQGAPDLLPPDQPSQLYSLSGAQAAYYYVFTVLMLVLVGLLSGVLSERLERAGGALQEAHRRAEQAERMAVLGRLAAGLAHEIRNPLGSISGAVQMLRTGVEKGEDRDLCDIVLRESNRLNELVTDMVDLSRSRRPELASIDAGRIVDDVVDLAGRSGRGAVDVTVRRLGDPHAQILADAGQIRQLVWNLVRNAIQASAAGGEVRVVLSSDENVLLSVEDDGAGIDSEAAAQLFDAFFTTRSQGTGLGLAVVKQIADEHGFSVKVWSDQGEGARFVVNFGPPKELHP